MQHVFQPFLISQDPRGAGYSKGSFPSRGGSWQMAVRGSKDWGWAALHRGEKKALRMKARVWVPIWISWRSESCYVQAYAFGKRIHVLKSASSLYIHSPFSPSPVSHMKKHQKANTLNKRTKRGVCGCVCVLSSMCYQEWTEEFGQRKYLAFLPHWSD